MRVSARRTLGSLALGLVVRRRRRSASYDRSWTLADAHASLWEQCVNARAPAGGVLTTGAGPGSDAEPYWRDAHDQRHALLLGCGVGRSGRGLNAAATGPSVGVTYANGQSGVPARVTTIINQNPPGALLLASEEG